MAYDLELAERIRELLEGEPAITEKKMFGGLAFLVHGRMAVAVSGRSGLLLRVPPEDTEQYASEPGVEPMVMRGRELVGWMDVEPAAIADPAALQRYVRVGLDYARSLPPPP